MIVLQAQKSGNKKTNILNILMEHPLIEFSENRFNIEKGH